MCFSSRQLPVLMPKVTRYEILLICVVVTTSC